MGGELGGLELEIRTKESDRLIQAPLTIIKLWVMLFL